MDHTPCYLTFIIGRKLAFETLYGDCQMNYLRERMVMTPLNMIVLQCSNFPKEKQKDFQRITSNV